MQVRAAPDHTAMGAGGVPCGPHGPTSVNWRSIAHVPVKLHRLGIGSVATEAKGTGTGPPCVLKVRAMAAQLRHMSGMQDWQTKG